MTSTDKTETNGWHSQADRLAVNHASLGTAVVTATEQARRRRALKREAQTIDEQAQQREIHLAQELEQAAAKIAGLERRIAVETAAARALRDELTERDAQPDLKARVAELEGEIAAAHDAIAHRDNEINSLQTSLDLALIRPEPVPQPSRGDDERTARIDFLESALAAAEAECARLANEALANDDKHRAESNAFNAVIADLTMRALVAEQQVGMLERSRNELVDGAGTLLKTIDSRDAALRRAERKMKSLTARVAALEAQTVAHERQANGSTPRRADDTSERERRKWAELAGALAKLMTLRRQSANRIRELSGSGLLASTIAF